MRIVRYPLEIVDYQQLQPLWPGRILSVGVGTGRTARRDLGQPGTITVPTIDMWALDNDANRRGANPPILGVWIVGTGNPLPEELIANDALFHGTVDMRATSGGAWHVWTAVVAVVEPPPTTGVGEVSTVDDMAEAIRAKHRARLERAARGE